MTNAFNDAVHERFILETYEMARHAAQMGNQPFGALLVREGEILLRAENTIHTDGDVTRHAELNLVSKASRQLPADILAQCWLYSSTEPCAMCAAAIYWSGIPLVIYGCPAESLARFAGGRFVIPCRELFARGIEAPQVIGPILEDAGAHIHEGFWS